MVAIEARDGARIAVRDSHGAGRTFVFLHGLGVPSALFDPLCDQLPGDWRVIRPDFRGHGGSAGAPAPRGLDDLADDVADLLTAKALDDVVIVGWSMGAMVAWEYLLRHGAARTAGLVCIDMTAKLANDATWRLGLRDGRDLAAVEAVADGLVADWPVFSDGLATALAPMGDEAARDALSARTRALAADNAPETLAALWRSMARKDFRNTLQRITTPTLVAYGAKSTFYARETSEDVASRLANARLVEFPEAGHAPHLDDPNAFAAALKAFVDVIDASTPARASAAPGE